MLKIILFFFRKLFPRRNALPLPHPHLLLDPYSALSCTVLFPLAAVKLIVGVPLASSNVYGIVFPCKKGNINCRESQNVLLSQVRCQA